jgi:hypothetical protein
MSHITHVENLKRGKRYYIRRRVQRKIDNIEATDVVVEELCTYHNLELYAGSLHLHVTDEDDVRQTVPLKTIQSITLC